MSDFWDRIITSTPLNREAGSVTAQGDVSGFRMEADDPHLQDGPHRTTRKPIDASFTDITGRRFGRFVVIGYSGHPKYVSGKGKSWWSVRCDCSRYTLIRARSLEKGSIQMCGECRLAEDIKAGKVFFDILEPKKTTRECLGLDSVNVSGELIEGEDGRLTLRPGSLHIVDQPLSLSEAFAVLRKPPGDLCTSSVSGTSDQDRSGGDPDHGNQTEDESG